MAVYLVDYENVYIDGLAGLSELPAEDRVHIFYTQNRCGLTFGLYEQLITCAAQVQLNEVEMSLKNGDPVKNALDIQLMMYAGYLIGTGQPQEIYIVSRDKDFLLGTGFFGRYLGNDGITLRLVPSIGAAHAPEEEPEAEPAQEEPSAGEDAFFPGEAALEGAEDDGYAAFTETLHGRVQPSFAAICDQYARPAEETYVPASFPEEDAPRFSVQFHNTVWNLLGKGTDEETVRRICEIISAADTLVDLNNGLARYYRDGQRAKDVYHKCKPRFDDLRHLSRARNKG